MGFVKNGHFCKNVNKKSEMCVNLMTFHNTSAVQLASMKLKEASGSTAGCCIFRMHLGWHSIPGRPRAGRMS